jgi:hypothetical protein
MQTGSTISGGVHPVRTVNLHNGSMLEWQQCNLCNSVRLNVTGTDDVALNTLTHGIFFCSMLNGSIVM